MPPSDRKPRSSALAQILGPVVVVMAASGAVLAWLGRRPGLTPAQLAGLVALVVLAGGALLVFWVRRVLVRMAARLEAGKTEAVQREKLEAVAQFVAGVAHELNNPLAAVIGFSDLLCQSGTDERSRHHLELVAKSAHRCHMIVQSLMGFAGQHPPDRSYLPVNGAIEEVLRLMAFDLRTSNVTVVREFQEPDPAVLADPQQLHQVLIHIVENARQAIEGYRAEGTLIIRTRGDGATVAIEIGDNGPGIRPEALPRIFDPFFTTKPVGKGTGLGLSLSHGIVRDHGGRITVRSEPGSGATFVVELPAAAPAAQAQPAPPAPVSPRRRSVLVVDDEEWIVELARQILENDGHEVRTAAGGEAAIASLRARRFDAVVCDWKMPGLNGVQLYEHLRATDPDMAGRMVFMTGDVISETFRRFLDENGRACLGKPFSAEELRASVAAVAAAPGQ